MGVFGNKKIVRSPYPVIKKDASFEGSVAGLFNAVAEIQALKNSLVLEFEKRFREIDTTLKKIQLIEKGEKGDPGEPVNEDRIVNRVRQLIPTPKNGDNADPKYIIEEVKKVIIPLLPVHETIVKSVLKKIPAPKNEMKVLQVTRGAEIDPASIIEALLKLPDDKNPMKLLDGLQQTVHAFKRQLGENRRGYLHGGGVPSLVAGAGITLTQTSDGGFIVSSTGSSVAPTYETVTFTGTSGSLAFPMIPGTLLLLIRGSQVQYPTTDYTISANQNITLVTTADSREKFLAIYYHN